MTTTDRCYTDLQYQMIIAAGLLTSLMMVIIAGDIWVWKGAMLNKLGVWVVEEGGENALWGASVLYTVIGLLAFAATVSSASIFRWFLLIMVTLLTLSGLNKLIGGFAEYDQVGWYFCFIFAANSLVNMTTVFFSWRWAKRREGETC